MDIQTPQAAQTPIQSSVPQNSAGGTLATVSLVFGILSFIPLIGFIGSIVGLTTGIIALVKKTLKQGMAITGLVLSVVGFFVSPMILILVVTLIGGQLNNTFSSVGSSLQKEKQPLDDQTPAAPNQPHEQNTNGQ